MDGMKLFAIYLVVMNVLGVAVMWSDKRRARLHRVADSGEGALWREPARGKRGNLGRNVFVPPPRRSTGILWPECRSFWFARRHLQFIWCTYMFYNKLL